MVPMKQYNCSKKDMCQTPPYALEPLLPYLDVGSVWEPATGEGYLADALCYNGFKVLRTDILTGEDFFNYKHYPTDTWDMIITNPPYSVGIKYRWIQRCYDLGKPFALLMPITTLGSSKAQKMFNKYGMELIVLDKRVDFKLPDVGWKGSGPQFSVGWFTYGLNIGNDITYANIDGKDKKEWIEYPPI